jgi:hypothetical protein
MVERLLHFQLDRNSKGDCLVHFGVDSRFVGTWKLNSGRSKLEGSGIGSNVSARLEPDGSGFKASVEAVTPQGQSDSYSYQLTLDGKPVTVTGTIQFDEVESNRVNDLVFTAIGKKDGHVVFSDRRALSEDGKPSPSRATAQSRNANRTQPSLCLSGPDSKFMGRTATLRMG